MKAPSFDYAKPTTLAETIALLTRHGDGARVIAGGQSLVPMLNMRLTAPALLVDINGLDELRGITVGDGTLRIGALSRHRDVIASPLVTEHAPLLAMAGPHIAHEAIRRRGTFGGSLANADPAAEWPACALALGARLELAGPAGRRAVAAEDYFTGLYETARQPDEILVAVEVPILRPGQRSGFLELSRRQGDYAMVGVAAHGGFAGSVFSGLRLAFFSIADRPVLVRQAAAAVEGRPFDAETVQAAQRALAADIEPLADLSCSADYKRHLARVLVGRVLTQLAGG